MFKWATVVGVLVKKIRMMVKVMRMMILSLDDDDGEQPCWPRIRGFGSVPWSPPKKITIHHSLCMDGSQVSPTNIQCNCLTIDPTLQ